jgi:uncharacterized protein YecE (DUF72 family)
LDPRIAEASKKVKKVFGYFNNHFQGYAPENCLQLIERLGRTMEKQRLAREKFSEKQVGLIDYTQLGC